MEKGMGRAYITPEVVKEIDHKAADNVATSDLQNRSKFKKNPYLMKFK